MTNPASKTNSDFKIASTESISLHQGRDGIAFRITDLSVNKPDGSLLIKPFSLALQAGERLMISGPSGCGKSTILRAAHGIWPWGSGQIEIDENARKLIVAQKPHLPLTSLKGMICFPKFMEHHTDDAVADALNKAGLCQFISDMNDTTKDGSFWERLSGGEKQRISFARIFLHKPSLLMLDEVTASLDVKAQDELYSMLLKELPDSAIISISHRMELAQYHNRHAVIENQSFKFRLPEPEPTDCPVCRAYIVSPGLTCPD
jgi:putative ATP-binding cassette transporter